MDNSRIDEHIQLCLLALLCFSKTHGSQAGLLLRPEHFDGVRRDIATAVFQYRSKYKGKPPGRKNLPLLIENLPLQDQRLESAREEARQVYSVWKQGFNKDYVVDKGSAFARLQNFRRGFQEVGDLILKGDVENVEEIEKKIYETLRYQPTTPSLGVRLSDPEALRFLDKQDEGYKLGIPQFDRINISLAPGTVTLYMAAKNTGKSWSCIHVGRECILQGARVLHISLEMSRDQVLKRYLQNWFSIASRDTKYVYPKIITDNNGRAIGWKMASGKAKHTLRDENIRRILAQKQQKWEHKFRRLIVEDFPTGSLTVGQLENYLDTLASIKGFYPDIIIIDYPDLMRVDRRNYRLDLGETYIQLRQLAIRRHLAIFEPTQIQRMGFNKAQVTGAHVAEDITKVNTADNVITYSQTPIEKMCKLARLRVEYARDTLVGTEVLIPQNYEIGKYIAGEPYDVTPRYMIDMLDANREHKGGGFTVEGDDADEQEEAMV